MTSALQAEIPSGAAPIHGHCVSGAGNRFYLIDARRRGLPVDASEWARLVCSAGAPEALAVRLEPDFVPDGLVWLLDGARGGQLRMVVHNADGSRPEACGNALRCLVHWAVERGALDGSEALVETDGGERDVRWERGSDGLRVRVCLGQPRDLGHLSVTEPVDSGADPTVFARVELANPHAVLCLETLEGAPFEALGRRLQDEVPGGTNVELVVRAEGNLTMRVWERGVGPTEACGTGSAAAAWVGAQRWGLAWPVVVSQPGGTLTIDRDDTGRLWLAGPVLEHGNVSFTGFAWATSSTS